ADASPTYLADAFDAQVQRLIGGESAPDTASMSTLPADERELLSTVIDSLSAFRATLRTGDGLMATRVAPLLALSEQIKSQTPLALPTLALCRKVTQFG